MSNVIPLNAPTNAHIHITAAALRIFEGKIMDRVTGATDNGNDVYQKMIDAGANELGFAAASMPGGSGVKITASRADLKELIAELDFTLMTGDFARDLSPGERNAARVLRNRAREWDVALGRKVAGLA